MPLKPDRYNSETESDNFTLEKRISILLTISGLTALAYTVGSDFFQGITFLEVIIYPSIWLIFFLTILSAGFIVIRHPVVPYLHILILLLASSITILEHQNTIYGLSLWIAAYILIYQYGLHKSYQIIKNIIFILSMVIFIELSIFYSPESGSDLGIILFLTLYLFLIYNINKSEINRILLSEKNMKKNIHELIQERTRLKKHIGEYQTKLGNLEKKIISIQDDKKPFNFKDCGLTPAEMRIVEALVRTRASNKQLSESLGIKENTVKQHLYKVFNKMGVDDRFQIIDLCKYNFE